MLAEPLVNIGSAAGLYSQIAGVLAGFAFTGLLLYLNRVPDNASTASTASGQNPTLATHESENATEYAHSGVTVVLFTTLGALIVCAVLYGELAGGAEAGGNSFSGIFLNGPAFGAAIIGMFYATALAATPFAHLHAMLSAARIVVGVVGPSISMLLIVLAAADISTSRCAVRHGGTVEARNTCLLSPDMSLGQPYGLGLLLTGVLFVVSIVLWLTLRPPEKSTSGWPANTMAVLIMAQAVGAVLMTGFLSEEPADYLLPGWAVEIVVSTTFAILLLQSVIVLRTCHGVAPSGKGNVPAVHDAAGVSPVAQL